MKVKLSLFMTIIVLCGAIHAKTIQERLEQALQEAQAQSELIWEEDLPSLAKLGEKYEYSQQPESVQKKLDKKVEQLILKSVQIGARHRFLSELLDCIKKQLNISTENQVAEREVVDKCFSIVAAKHKRMIAIGKEKEDEKAIAETVEKELERIRKKDLRQSWFWWLW